MKLEQGTSHELTTTFSRCLLTPASITAADIESLTTLSNQFPYCQILHAFLGKATLNHDQLFDQRLSKAALYSSDKNMLYATINNPEILTAVSLKRNYNTADILNNHLQQELLQPEDFITDTNFLMVDDDPESIPAFAPIEGDAIIEEAIEPQNEEFDNLNADTFNPIEEAIVDSPSHTMVSSDENILIETKENQTFSPVDTHELSKYDDDKMPFSFLWWLSKTRKEHSKTYQPYLLPHLKQEHHVPNDNANNELKNQIVEEIFHQQAPLKEFAGDENTLTFKHKEEAVLDTFIRTTPQIKPPKGENINPENKARESSQDSNDLVSETLAEIYTRQMLFDKAIDTYKKLNLKFPQKSAYFAELIRSLEKNK